MMYLYYSLNLDLVSPRALAVVVCFDLTIGVYTLDSLVSIFYRFSKLFIN